MLETSYHFDWEQKKMVKTEVKELEIGQRVIFVEYACNESFYYVVSKPDEHGRQLMIEDGGNYREDNWELGMNDEPYSQKFGIGLYYDDSEEFANYRKPQAELDELIQKAKEHRQLEKEQAEKERQEFKAEMERLKKVYDYLTPVTDNYDRKQIKANIKALLEHRFSGTKFSLAKSSYYSYYITWTDGENEEEVKKVANIFIDHTWNGYEEYHEYTPDAFTTLFGGCDYGFSAHRKYTDEFKSRVKAMLKEEYPKLDLDSTTYVDIHYSKFTEGLSYCNHTSNGIMYSGKDLLEYVLSKTSASELGLTKPEPKHETKPEPINAEGLTIVDYSEKAFAVTGDTKPFADKLRKLGGSFNARLSCGSGWIFSKRKLDNVRECLGIAE